MIKYALACENDHAFESWFSSGDAFETQAKRGFVTCPVCHSAKVEKRIMSPSVARMDRGQARAPAPEPEAATPQPMAILSDKEREMRAMLRALKEHVTKNAEDVGERFPDEARRMHYGDIEHRSIYGKASPVDAKALHEEGIEVHPLPILPDDRN
jgi:hypothetical protein